MHMIVKVIVAVSALFGACIIAALIYFYWALNIERDCFVSVTYGIGEIESGHTLTRDQIVKAIQSAEVAFEQKFLGDVLAYREENAQVIFDIKYNEYYQRVVGATNAFNEFYTNQSDEYEKLLSEIERLTSTYENERLIFEELKQDYDVQTMVYESAAEARSKGDITEDEFDRVSANLEDARLKALNAGNLVNDLSADIKVKGERINTIAAEINQMTAEAKLSQQVIDSNNVPSAFSLFPTPNSTIVEIEYFANSNDLTHTASAALASVVKPEGYNPESDMFKGTFLHTLFDIERSDLVFEVCKL